MEPWEGEQFQHFHYSDPLKVKAACLAYAAGRPGIPGGVFLLFGAAMWFAGFLVGLGLGGMR